MSVTIIINPISGGASLDRARRRAEHAASALAAHGERGDVFITERPGHAHDLAKSAVAQGARLVMAWGGDGTVNEIASALAFGRGALGMVPAGSGNGLAKALDVSVKPDVAIVEALTAQPRTIDVGRLNDRLFVSVAGVGFDAHVAACFARDLGQRRKFSGYIKVSARELMKYRPRAYRISGDASLAPANALLITLANGSQFGNGARIAPDARVDDGYLDLVVVEESSRLKTLCAMPSLFNGRIARVSGVTMRRVSSLTIESDEAMPFHVDGEPATGGTTLEAKIHPAALHVAVR